jgi:hypothetical protein
MPVVRYALRAIVELQAEKGEAHSVISSDIRPNIASGLVIDPFVPVDGEIPLLTNTETSKVIFKKCR